MDCARLWRKVGKRIKDSHTSRKLGLFCTVEPTALAVGHSDNLAILHTAIKYYPCNYYIQSVNDAVMQIAARADLQLDAVTSVVVYTVSAAMALVCEPIEQKRQPKVMIDAQFSVPFNAAAKAAIAMGSWPLAGTALTLR